MLEAFVAHLRVIAAMIAMCCWWFQMSKDSWSAASTIRCKPMIYSWHSNNFTSQSFPKLMSDNFRGNTWKWPSWTKIWCSVSAMGSGASGASVASPAIAEKPVSLNLGPICDGRLCAKDINGYLKQLLVGGLEHDFYIILGNSSSQLTFIFFRGVQTTKQVVNWCYRIWYPTLQYNLQHYLTESNIINTYCSLHLRCPASCDIMSFAVLYGIEDVMGLSNDILLTVLLRCIIQESNYCLCMFVSFCVAVSRIFSTFQK